MDLFHQRCYWATHKEIKKPSVPDILDLGDLIWGREEQSKNRDHIETHKLVIVLVKQSPGNRIYCLLPGHDSSGNQHAKKRIHPSGNNNTEMEKFFQN